MKFYLALIGILAAHLLILIWLRFTAWPEMFSYPYLLNNGFNLYKDIALPYQPVLVLILSALYKIFGYQLLLLKIFTWGLILSFDVILFFIAQKVIGKNWKSLIPPLIYLLIQPFMDGDMLWFDLATVPFLGLAVLSHIYLNGFKKLFFLGLFLSLAFFTKQQLGVVIVFITIYLFIKERSFFKIYPLLLGFLTPAFFIAVYISLFNNWSSFLFWTVEVPLVWYPKFPGYTHLPSFDDLFKLILLTLPAGLLFSRLKKGNDQLWLVLLIFLGSLITSFPRFEFFRLQPSVAVFCLMMAFLIPKKWFLSLLIFLPVLWVVWTLPKFKSVDLYQARFYENSDFKTAELIDQNSNVSDRIYLLGPHSLNYVLANRLPSKPWVDNYVWYMEIPGVQQSVLSGFNSYNPKEIFWVGPKDGNWFDLGTYQPAQISAYIEQHYQFSKMIDGGIGLWIRKD